MPRFTDFEVAPGGRYVAVRMTIDNQYRLVVFDIAGDNFDVVYALTEDETYGARWCHWANEERLIVSIGFAGERGLGGRVDTQERRLFSILMGENKLVPLYRVRRDEAPLQIQDRIVSFLPDAPDHILVQYNKTDPTQPQVYQVNVNKTTRHKRVSPGKRNVRYWDTDSDGNVRIGTGLTTDGERTLFFRLAGDKKWQNFSHRVENAGSVFRPLGFSAEANVAYVISNHEVDPAGLYTFNIETDTFGELVFSHPTVDISSVRIDPESGEVASINFVDDDVETVWYSRRPINEAISKLTKRFPDKSLTTYAVSQDANHAVVRMSGVRDAGQYFVYNNVEKRIKLMPPQYPDLPEDVLAETITTEYSARDGLAIPAYVTLPPGINSLEEARGLPFVIHPHGGPTARDFLRFSFDVQFLASRGYGVLQMNFRGSSGYGTEFRDAGNKEWGQAMQDDITDGAQWVVDSGYADPKRLAILGGSYGGYAALMGVVKTPDLYQCAVSFAGVSDLPDLIRTARRYIDGRFSTRFIGDLWRDRKMLAENSPARRADDVKVPVLLMHGDKDLVVDVSQSRLMAKRLRRADKQVEFIEFEDGTHYLSLYRNRLRYLQETDRFLNRCIGDAAVVASR